MIYSGSLSMSFLTALLALVALAGTALGQEQAPDQTRQHAVIAHATIMGFTFAFLMPMGAIMIRIVKVRNVLWWHAAVMAFAYTLALAGLGLGVYIAVVPDSQLTASNGHPIIGIVVVVLLLLQLPLGLFHHYLYKRKHSRTIWSTFHVWWGRALVTLAIINGGLGLQLSDNTVKGEIAYGVIAGVIWLVWAVVSTTSHINSRGAQAEADEKVSGAAHPL